MNHAARHYPKNIADCSVELQVKRLLGSELIDGNQALQNELQAITDICESMRLHTEFCNQQHVLMQTTERSLVSASNS